MIPVGVMMPGTPSDPYARFKMHNPRSAIEQAYLRNVGENPASRHAVVGGPNTFKVTEFRPGGPYGDRSGVITSATPQGFVTALWYTRGANVFYGDGRPSHRPDVAEHVHGDLVEQELAKGAQLDGHLTKSNPGRSVRSNPLLAIVGNPGHESFDYGDTPHSISGKKIVALMRKHKVTIKQLAQKLGVPMNRVRQVRKRGVLKNEGQGYVYDWIHGIQQAGHNRVAGAGAKGRVKSASRKPAARVKKNRVATPGRKKPSTKRKRYSLSEGKRRFDGYDEAHDAYTKFHGSNPQSVDVYVLDDGSDDVRVEPVHAALHRTLETNYVVPWDSNKKGTLWLHEHKEGAGLRGLEKGVAMPNPDDLPLEVYDPRTKTTRKLGGRFQVSDWWYD